MNSFEKYKILFLANLVFLAHVLLVLIILFGWHFETMHVVYISVLAVTLISELFFGYCLLTQIEFDLRKKLEPSLNYDSSFLSYYGYKLFRINISGKYIKWPAVIFLTLSLLKTLV